jgi:hypothetical protein
MFYKVTYSYYIWDVTSYNLAPTFQSILLPLSSSTVEVKNGNRCVPTYLPGAALSCLKHVVNGLPQLQHCGNYTITLATNRATSSSSIERHLSIMEMKHADCEAVKIKQWHVHGLPPGFVCFQAGKLAISTG